MQVSQDGLVVVFPWQEAQRKRMGRESFARHPQGLRAAGEVSGHSLAGLIEAGFQAVSAAAWGRTELGDPAPGTALLVPFAIERLRREADALPTVERVAAAFDTTAGIDADTAAAFAALNAHARRAADHRRLLCAALGRAFGERDGRMLRVLELGAGHGEGIERALPALAAAGARVEYLYAAASPARAAFVASRFADQPRLRCLAFDPDTLAAAARERGFDLIVADATGAAHGAGGDGCGGEAANPLHVRAAAAWLAADGELLLIERGDVPRDWTATLAGAGLASLHETDPNGPAALRLHRLRRAPRSMTASNISTDRLRTLLSQITAAVLDVDAGELDPADNFTDLGVDSVLAVELVAELNAALGTRLEPTVVCDYPTIQALTESLGRDASVAARIAPQERPQPVAAPQSPAPTQPTPISSSAF